MERYFIVKLIEKSERCIKRLKVEPDNWLIRGELVAFQCALDFEHNSANMPKLSPNENERLLKVIEYE